MGHSQTNNIYVLIGGTIKTFEINVGLDFKIF